MITIEGIGETTKIWRQWVVQADFEELRAVYRVIVAEFRVRRALLHAQLANQSFSIPDRVEAMRRRGR